MTIADVLKKDEKLLIGKATYTKKCDSLGHCFVAKCKHYGQASNRQRYCTIYKDLMPKTEEPAKPAAPAKPATPAAAPAARPAAVATPSYYNAPRPTTYAAVPATASYAYAARPATPTATPWYSPASAKWISTASTVLLATLFAMTQ